MTVERDSLGFDAPAPLGHPARASIPVGASTGPEVGDALPDFTLRSALGETVNFHHDRDGKKSVLVFYRSAVW